MVTHGFRVSGRVTNPFGRGLSDDLLEDLMDGPCATVFRACKKVRLDVRLRAKVCGPARSRFRKNEFSAGRSSAGPRSRNRAVSRHRHHWLVRTPSTVAPAARIAAPIFRACSRPCASRLRWVVQSLSTNVAGSPVPGATAWRRMATMPGSDRRAKRASAAVGTGGRKKAATRAAARSRRVIGSCVRRSGDQGRLDETSAPIRKLPVMLGVHCAG